MNSTKTKNMIHNYIPLQGIFSYENKIYYNAQHSSPQSTSTLLIMQFNEQLYENQRKYLQKVQDLKNKDNFKKKILCPFKMMTDNYQKKKVISLVYNQKLLPLSYFIKSGYQFQANQILSILKSGLQSLEQLHISNFVHGKINPNTIYFATHNEKVFNDFEDQEQSNFAAVNLSICDIKNLELKKEKNHKKALEQILFQSQNECMGLEISYKDDIQKLVYVLLHLISKGKIFSSSRYEKEWETQSSLRNWKLTNFFEEMVNMVPEQLDIICEVYIASLDMSLGMKPDYPILIKSVERRKRQLFEKKTKKIITGGIGIHSNDEQLQEIQQSKIELKLGNAFKGLF